MATFVKGDAVLNASGYELLEKVGETYNSLATASDINFEVSAMEFEPGDHLLAVKAKAQYTCIYFHPNFLNVNMSFDLLRSDQYDDMASVHDLFLLKPYGWVSNTAPI